MAHELSVDDKKVLISVLENFTLPNGTPAKQAAIINKFSELSKKLAGQIKEDEAVNMGKGTATAEDIKEALLLEEKVNQGEKVEDPKEPLQFPVPSPS